MINLLPPESKAEIRAAHTNTLLSRYIFLLMMAIGLLIAFVGFFYFYLANVRANAEREITDNNQKVANYKKVQKEAETFRSNLSIAKQIMDKKVDYTRVILRISNILPSGIILSTLTLDPSTIDKETSLNAHAKTYQDALNLKESLEKSGLFSDVHFLKIDQPEASNTSPSDEYALKVTMSVKFKREVIR